MADQKPFRALSLDGGGMRGLYTATYLRCVAEGFSKRRNCGSLDVGSAFDLIVGTSTGAIIGCALAAGLDLRVVADLYLKHGKQIFPKRVPTTLPGVLWDVCVRPGALRKGTSALRKVLQDCFGGTTIKELYDDRKIALAICAVDMLHHRSWVFKTPHHRDSNHRDDAYRIVDVCMATSSAPVFRSLAAIDDPSGTPAAYGVFADGGLWANNPVLIALIESLAMAGPGRDIQIYCLGTCPRPSGELVRKDDTDRGLLQWKFGGSVATLSIDAQEFAFDNMARMLSAHLGRKCEVLRFPREDVPANLMQFLELDDTRTDAATALVNAARLDANMANSRCNDASSREGRLICDLFMDMKESTLVRSE